MDIKPNSPFGAKYVLIDWRDRFVMEFVKENMDTIKELLIKVELKDEANMHLIQLPFSNVQYFKKYGKFGQLNPELSVIKVDTDYKTIHKISDNMLPFLLIVLLNEEKTDQFIRLFAIKK